MKHCVYGLVYRPPVPPFWIVAVILFILLGMYIGGF